MVLKSSVPLNNSGCIIAMKYGFSRGKASYPWVEKWFDRETPQVALKRNSPHIFLLPSLHEFLSCLNHSSTVPHMTPWLSKWCHPKYLFELPVALDLLVDTDFTNLLHTCWTRCKNWLLLLARAISSSLTALWGIHFFYPDSPQVFFFCVMRAGAGHPCNGLWRGYRIRETFLAIKSSGRSFGILPLRISCVPILLGSLSVLCCLPPSASKFHRSNRVLAVSSFSLSLIKG